MTEAPTPAESNMRMWWLRGGFWYLLLPVLSLGFLTFIPFFHAAKRLRDRGILMLGVTYSVAAALAITINQVYHPFRTNNPAGWAPLLQGMLTVYLIAGGTIQLAGLRRRVYLGMSKQATEIGEEELRAAVESRNVTERRAQVFSDWIGLTLVVAIVLTFGLAIPAAAIVQTLTGRNNAFVGSDFVYNSPFLLLAVAATVGIIVWLAVGYNPTDRLLLHFVFLTAAVIVNVYLGYSIWVIATHFFNAHHAVSPHRLSLMVWWNLVHSIPLVDVDSALDWEQPLTEYTAAIGWLFLLQRIVLILTLARAIQVLINRWTSLSRQRPAASAATPAAVEK